MKIFPRTHHDDEEVAALLDTCFGPARRARTAELLRRGATRLNRASFVARDDGNRLLGSVECHMLLWSAGGAEKPIVLLGPIATDPTHRGHRIGVQLMEAALAEADRHRQPVMLIGDEPYYRRWGFSSAATGEWCLPGPVERDRLLLRSADPATWAGPARFRPAPADFPEPSPMLEESRITG